MKDIMGMMKGLGEMKAKMEAAQADTVAELDALMDLANRDAGIAKELKMGWFLQQLNQCLRRGHESGGFDSIIYDYTN